MTSVAIRQYQESDIEPLLDAVLESKPELSLWMPWCHRDYGKVDAEDWVRSRPNAWESDMEWSFVVVDSGGKILGTCGFHNLDLSSGVAELGYWIRSGCTRCGFGSRAIQIACEWVFREREIHRVEILMSTKNTASQRAAEKAGANREGTLRQRLLLGDQRHDAFLYSILKDDKTLEPDG
ncbi:GNAT family N-acetyltransferase [Novipirellula sp. SH528]|uniref:GNAT family N-acetyltransferase n=1 Tax=Novipirellula sp. SH528 TaxID=3454466 RepID=UPI003FA03433